MNNYYEQDQKLFQAVSELMAGNTDSYYVMYDLSIKYIYKIVFDIVKDYHTTEDLVQETYITIYNKISTLQEPGKFFSWAGRIATNLTLRYMQNNKRELLTLDSEDGASEFAFEVATQDNEAFIPENIVMDEEKQRIIAEIVDGLSVEQKITVQYFYYEEMSVTEIAEVMGCSRGTVMSRLNYARKTIKTAVLDLSENMNTPLYSLSAIPLFYIVFRYTVQQFMFAGAGAAAAGVAGDVAAAEMSAGEGASTVGMSAVEGKGAVAVGAGTSGGTTAGSVAASTVGKGVLAKVGGSIGAKVAIGLVATGVAVTGGVAIHKAVTGGMKPKTVPMVIHMETVPNTDTVEIVDDTFTYEYINVTYNDEEITIGYDDAIYEYGFDNHETLSPELEQLHEEEFENVVSAPSEDLEDVLGDEIEFTIDEEEFTLHVEDVQVENSEDGSTSIIITGECETPENVDELFDGYQTDYENTLTALEEEAIAIQAEWDEKNVLVKEYFMGVLQDFYLYGTDPFGNELGYVAPYSEPPQVTHYAFEDIDGDGLIELIVRHTQGDIIYGYNPDTQIVVEEYKAGIGGKFTADYSYYDSGFVVKNYMGYTDVYKCDETTDVYDRDTSVWGCMGLDKYIYGSVSDFDYFSNKENPELIAEEQELLNTYDKDGDGHISVEVEYDENHEKIPVAYYDNAEYAAKLNQVVLGGKIVEPEFFDISTVAENLDLADISNAQYMKIVEDFYLYGTDPFGNNCDYGPGPWDDIQDYAICDIDGDNVDELIVRYHSKLRVYEYDTNTMQVREEFIWNAENSSVESVEFYENGYVLGGGGDPMYVLKLDTASCTDECVLICNANLGVNWFQSHVGDPMTDEEYLALYDKDGNGVIYMEDSYDESTGEYIFVYYDDAELEERISEVTGGSKPLNIEYIDMSTVVNQ